MNSQRLIGTLLRLLSEFGPLSAADLAALAQRRQANATSASGVTLASFRQVRACLQDEPVFVQRDDGLWTLNELPTEHATALTRDGRGAQSGEGFQEGMATQQPATAPIRFNDFPLFASPGGRARGDRRHPDFSRIPVAASLKELQLSADVRTALEGAGIRTVGDLLLTPSSALAEIESVGERSLGHLRSAVRRLEAAESGPPAEDQPSRGAADARAPLLVEGYACDEGWDGACPACGGAVEATGEVTCDDDEIYYCSSCDKSFYVETASGETWASPEDGDEGIDEAQEPSVESDDSFVDDDSVEEGPQESPLSSRASARGRQPSREPDEGLRTRASALFQFLHDVVELRSRTVRSVDQYERDGYVLWLAGVPRQKGCICAAWPESEGNAPVLSPWLEVSRPRLEEPPDPPELLRPWVDAAELADSSLDYPELRESLPITRLSHLSGLSADDEGRVGFEQISGLLESWSEFVEKRWQPWATRDRLLQPVQSLYNDLFSVHQTLQSRGDEFELVVGVGLLQWQRDGHEIKRHLLTSRGELIFESDRALISLGPGPEGVALRLEQDMLEVSDRPAPDQLRSVAEQLEQVDEDFWHADSVKAVARMWVNSVASEGAFVDELTPPPRSSERPTVTWSPALILRKRTARPLLEFYENVMSLLAEGEEVPDGVAALVTVEEPDGAEDADSLEQHGRLEPEDVFFPLPANEEQLEILRRMRSSKGVLVQGPPGTGKSHTIANLITHLLATGRRVLVTSQTPRALRVLQHKLPSEIADLCVLLVGDDRDAMRDLERSVQSITDRFNSWDSRESQRRIAQLKKQLDEARRVVEKRRRELIALRESEVDEYSPVGGIYSGSFTAIARRLREEQERYEWLRPEGQVDGNSRCPITDDEALELLRLMRRLRAADPVLLEPALPDLDLIPGGDEFEDLMRREEQAREACRQAEENEDARLGEQMREAPADALRSLQRVVLTYSDVLSRTALNGEPWTMSVVRDLVAGRRGRWEAVLRVCEEVLGDVDALGEGAGKQSVSGTEGHELLAMRQEADALRSHLAAGGSLGNFLRRPQPVKRARYIIENVRVNGAIPDSCAVLDQLVNWIDVNSALTRLDAEWQAHRALPSGTLLQRLAEHRGYAQDLASLFELAECANDARRQLESFGVQAPVDWADPIALASLRRGVDAAFRRLTLAAVEGEFQSIVGALRGTRGDDVQRPLVDSLVSAVLQRDVAGYRSARGMIASARAYQGELQRKGELIERVRGAAPTLPDTLYGALDDPLWDERMGSFEAAWSWALADKWLRSSLSPGALERLATRIEDDEQTVRRSLSELAAERAWAHCFQRMTQLERMNLVAWMKAMRKLGKGKGKYAARYRREARQYLEGCRSAIPAWVMPTFRVAETVRPGTDRFDVVIIDEASQSGLETLFLHYLGDKLVVVGDDKQISPEHVGTNLQDVEDLRRRHIADLPLSATFSVGTSLFSQAEIRLGNRVRLREHFRCMPEIIQFCNELQYAGEPLVPLRQFGAGRLSPIVVRHVDDGYQEGSSSLAVNRPEADAVVEAIVACCRDTRYTEATMGVVSLLGESQARLVERQLLATLGAEEMERRSLVCGDAYSFQGDERDVMFLTMVSAPNARIGALSTESARQRFNVAVSRAKDQLWLFHSVTPRDLSPTCVRTTLLEYCTNPTSDELIVPDLSLGELRKLGAESDRRESRPPRPFDSWFEVDVFVRIAERGYRVAPQYSVAGYRIDMVVEGSSSRLAVECDGDEFHGGLEQFEADMVRQRRLERCGWTFWRVGGGEFYRDPDVAMSSLWEALERHDILPGGALRPAAKETLLGDAACVVDPVRPLASKSSDEARNHSQGIDGAADDAVPNRDEADDADTDMAQDGRHDDHLDPAAAAPQSGLAQEEEEPLSWEAYESGADAWVFPELDERPPALTVDRPTTAPQGAKAETDRSQARRDDRKGWLRHGVLGELPPETVSAVAPYRVARVTLNTYGLHLAQVPRATLADAIVRVVDVESPIMIVEVASRVAKACGLGRVRRSTEKAFRDAAAYAASYRMLVQDGDVLWSNDDRGPVIRDRSRCPRELRLTEAVPTVEIEWAVHRVVQKARSIARGDVARAVSRLLGFQRTSEVFASRVGAAVEAGLSHGVIVLHSGRLSIGDDDGDAGSGGAVCTGSPKSPSAPNRGSQGPLRASDESSVRAEQARTLIQALRTSTTRRALLDQIHRLGTASIGPLIEVLADADLAPLAVTALVEFGPLAKPDLVRALASPDVHVRIHAGEALSRAGLDDDI